MLALAGNKLAQLPESISGLTNLQVRFRNFVFVPIITNALNEAAFVSVGKFAWRFLTYESVLILV